MQKSEHSPSSCEQEIFAFSSFLPDFHLVTGGSDWIIQGRAQVKHLEPVPDFHLIQYRLVQSDAFHVFDRV